MRFLSGLRERFVPVRRMTQRIQALERALASTAGPAGQHGDSIGPVVLHLHIPKTAGSSLNRALIEQFRRRKVYDFHVERRQQFEDLPPEQRRQFDLVIGHMPYGLHRFLRTEYRYLFVLRNPAERIYSLYRYISRREDHPLFSEVGKGRMKFGDFLDYSQTRRDLRDDLDNAQMRQVAGDDAANVVSMRECLRLACEHAFHQNTRFGLVERYREFLASLAHEGLVDPRSHFEENTQKNSRNLGDEIGDLTLAQRDMLDAYCEWDRRFYAICAAALP